MYDEIVNKYYSVIYNYCRTKLGYSRTAAEDVTQEVFFALYKKLDRLRLSDNIKIWLYKAANYEIKKYIRKNPSFVPMEECPEEISVVDDNFPSLSESDFDCLSNDEKSIIVDYYSGESKESIAKANKLTINALYIRIHRIRRKLAARVIDRNKVQL